MGVISGGRGGKGVGTSLPIHLFGNAASKNRRTSEPQCGGAPSCWKIIHGWNSSEVQRKVPICPGSFLVINGCNQGKNLCSPCITMHGNMNVKIDHETGHWLAWLKTTAICDVTPFGSLDRHQRIRRTPFLRCDASYCSRSVLYQCIKENCRDTILSSHLWQTTGGAVPFILNVTVWRWVIRFRPRTSP